MVWTLLYELTKDAFGVASDLKQAAAQRAVAIRCFHMECQINLDLLSLLDMQEVDDPDYLDVIGHLQTDVLTAILASADNVNILTKAAPPDRSLDDQGIAWESNEDPAFANRSTYELAEFIYRKTAALKAFAEFGRKGETLRAVRTRQRLNNLKDQVVEVNKRLRNMQDN